MLASVIRWLLYTPLHLSALFLGSVEGVLRATTSWNPDAECSLCRVKFLVQTCARWRAAQIANWVYGKETRRKPAGLRRNPGLRSAPSEPPVSRRDLELRFTCSHCSPVDDNQDVDDEYYDVERKEQPRSSATQRLYDLASRTVAVPLRPVRYGVETLKSGGKRLLDIRRRIVCLLRDSATRVRTLPARARALPAQLMGKCRTVIGHVLPRRVVTSPWEEGDKMETDDVTGGRKEMREEPAKRTTEDHPSPGKYLMGAVSDIITNRQTTPSQEHDARGPSLGTRTAADAHCPIMDRLALIVFWAGKTFMGISGSHEDEVAFLNNYHRRLQKMRSRAWNIDYSSKEDEVRAPDLPPSLLVDVPSAIDNGTHTYELRKRKSTAV